MEYDLVQFQILIDSRMHDTGMGPILSDRHCMLPKE